MSSYKDMYYQLFNKITEIISELQEVQSEMEENFIDESFEDTDE